MSRSGAEDFNPKPRGQKVPEYGVGDVIWETTRDVAQALQEGGVVIHDVDIRSSHPEAPSDFVIDVLVGMSIPGTRAGGIGEDVVFVMPLTVKYVGEQPSEDYTRIRAIIIPTQPGQPPIQLTQTEIKDREDLQAIGRSVYKAFVDYIHQN